MDSRFKRLFGLVLLRDFVRRYFTRTVLELSAVRKTPPVQAAIKRRRQKRRPIQETPSEVFVWGMTLLIISLVGVIVLEIIHLLVLGQVNNEMLMIISGLVGALSMKFFTEKKT